jgi:CBS domain-containing protein
MANAAFWFGLMRGMSREHGDVSRVMSFETAHENFLAAARLGLQAQFTWPGRPSVPARDLILQDLLPLAREGLAELGIVPADAERYLGILEERVERPQTGAQWMIDSLAHMGADGTRAERMAALTLATIERQATNEPVARWPPASLSDAGGWRKHYAKVRHFMVTDLFTVHEDELVDLVAALMDWEHVRHVPVEDDQHRLVGLVTHRTLLRLLSRGRLAPDDAVPVSEIMHREVVTVAPDTPTLEAVALMKEHRIGCLPVVEAEGRLVGMITDRDFLTMAGQLLEQGAEQR